MWRGEVACRLGRMKRGIVMVSCLLMVAGLFLFARDGRIFATFLLDLIVGTISSAPQPDLPPHEYSWGAKEWGKMNAEMAGSAIGAMLMAVGYVLLMPVLAPPARGAGRAGLYVSSSLMVISGLLWMWVALSLYGSMRMMAGYGVANPVQLGEDMPVRAADLGRFGLVGAMAVLVILGIGAVLSREAGASVFAPGRRLLAKFSGLAGLCFGACLVSVAFGPLTGVLTGKGSLNPAGLAEQIQTAIRLIGFAGGSLAVAGGLGIAALSLRANRSDEEG